MRKTLLRLLLFLVLTFVVVLFAVDRMYLKGDFADSGEGLIPVVETQLARPTKSLKTAQERKNRTLMRKKEGQVPFPVSPKARNSINKKVIEYLAEMQEKSISSVGNRNFAQSLRAPNEKPLVLVAASWRTGSSFLGEMLARMPGAFYTFEPLLEGLQIGNMSSLLVLENIFHCNFNVVRYSKETSWMLSRNRAYIRACKFFPDRSTKQHLCTDPLIMSHACNASKISIAKVVRLPMSQLGELINKLPNLKILALFRDPRPTFLSRSKLSWCLPDRCANPSVQCETMQQDFQSASLLQDSMPDRLMLVRYEDLSADPMRVAKKIFNFLGMAMPEEVVFHVKSHTSRRFKTTRGSGDKRGNLNARVFRSKIADPHSTFRQSNAQVNVWRLTMDWEKAKYIQDLCSASLQNLGYVKFSSERDLRNLSLPSYLPWK